MKRPRLHCEGDGACISRARLSGRRLKAGAEPGWRVRARPTRAGCQGRPLKKSVIRIFGMTWQGARFAVDMAKTIGFIGEERHTQIIAMKISVTKIIWADLFN